MDSSRERATQQRLDEKRQRNELLGASILNSSMKGRTLTTQLSAASLERERMSATLEAREISRQQLHNRKTQREMEEMRSTAAWKSSLEVMKQRTHAEQDFRQSQRMKQEQRRTHRQMENTRNTMDAIDSFEQQLIHTTSGPLLQPLASTTSANTPLPTIRPNRTQKLSPSRTPTASTASAQSAPAPAAATMPLLSEQDHKRILISQYAQIAPAAPVPSFPAVQPFPDQTGSVSAVAELNTSIAQQHAEEEARTRFIAMVQARATYEREREERERQRDAQAKNAEFIQSRYQQFLDDDKARQRARVERYCRNIATNLVDLSTKVGEYRLMTNGEPVPQQLWREWMHPLQFSPQTDDFYDSDSEHEEDPAAAAQAVADAGGDTLEVNMAGLCSVRAQWLQRADRALLSAFGALDDSRKDKEKEKDSRMDRNKRKGQQTASMSHVAVSLPDPAGVMPGETLSLPLTVGTVPISDADLLLLRKPADDAVPAADIKGDALQVLDDDALRHYTEYYGAWSAASLHHTHASLLVDDRSEYSDHAAPAEECQTIPQIPTSLWSSGCVCGAQNADSETSKDTEQTANSCVCGLTGASNPLLQSMVDKLAAVAAQKEPVPIPVLITPNQLALCVIGKPCSGKRTQCAHLAARFGLQIITLETVVAEALQSAQNADPSIFNPRNLPKVAAAAGLPLTNTHSQGVQPPKRLGSGSPVATGALHRPALPMAACALEQQLLGYKASKHLVKGEAVPEDILVPLVANAIQTVRARREEYNAHIAASDAPAPVYTVGSNEAPAGLGGFVLLGYPANLSEARALEKILTGFEMARPKRSTSTKATLGRRGSVMPVATSANAQPLHAMMPGEPLWTSAFDAVFELDVPNTTAVERAAAVSRTDIGDAIAAYEAVQPKLLSWYASFGAFRVIDATEEEGVVAEGLDELVVAAIHKTLKLAREQRETELAADEARGQEQAKLQARAAYTTDPVDAPEWSKQLEHISSWCDEYATAAASSSSYGDIPAAWNAFQDRPLAMLLINAWKETDDIYRHRVKKLFRALRAERSGAMEYMAETTHTFQTFLRRPDNRMTLVDAFQTSFNSIPADLRADPACKDELLLRSEELAEHLYQICERRAEEAETELVSIAQSGCMEYRLVALCTIYVCLIQLELDRYLRVMSIVQHFFTCLQDLSTMEPRAPPVVSVKQIASVLAAITSNTPASQLAVQQLASISNATPLGDRFMSLLPSLQSLFDLSDKPTGKKNTVSSGKSASKLVSGSNATKTLASLLSMGSQGTTSSSSSAAPANKRTDTKRPTSTPIPLIGDHVRPCVESVLAEAVNYAWAQRMPSDAAAPQVEADKGKKRREDKSVATRKNDGENPEDVGTPVTSDVAALARLDLSENPEVNLSAFQSGVVDEAGFNLTLSPQTMQQALSAITHSNADTNTFQQQLTALIQTENTLLRTRLSSLYGTCLGEVVSLASYCREHVGQMMDQALHMQISREQAAVAQLIKYIRLSVVRHQTLNCTIITSDSDTFMVDVVDKTPVTPAHLKIHDPLEI